MTLHAVPWAYMKFHELACSYMSLYADPFFVWAAHKKFAVLVPLDMQIQTNLLLKLPQNGENGDLMRCFIQSQM